MTHPYRGGHQASGQSKRGSDSIARLKDLNVTSGCDKMFGSGEPGYTCANDDHRLDVLSDDFRCGTLTRQQRTMHGGRKV
ncbi:MAG: hypothetical protein KC481_17720 [Acidimicrobiaceae bacterium]|jgi:hypothetical protein|nr:hypothetical protein [bacterium]MCO4835499.1 hypothetical protein [Acidimicrobiaceae bacterium]MDB2392649.1 hypothetical protein [Acidimicrobiaceae bacterium]